jgi:hypothetical protein
MPYPVMARVWQITGATADYIMFGRMDTLPLELGQRLRAANRGTRAAG